MKHRGYDITPVPGNPRYGTAPIAPPGLPDMGLVVLDLDRPPRLREYSGDGESVVVVGRVSAPDASGRRRVSIGGRPSPDAGSVDAAVQFILREREAWESDGWRGDARLAIRDFMSTLREWG